MVLKNLEKIRKENGKTFQDVADKAGLTKEFYWMIEKGKRKLSYENVRILVIKKYMEELLRRTIILMIFIFYII